MSTFIFDLDGTLYLNPDPIAGAVQAVAELQGLGHTILYATNNSTRTRDEYRVKLETMGFPYQENCLATSAFATARYLQSLEKSPCSILTLGGDAIASEIREAGSLAKINEGCDYDTVVVGLDQRFNYDALAAAQLAVMAGAILIATNRDPQYPTSGRIFPGAGSVVAAVETASQSTAITIGKPSHYLFQSLIDLNSIDPATVIIVGDNLLTDIAAAATMGLKSVLVLTGISAEPAAGDPLKADVTIPSIATLIPRLRQNRPELLNAQ